MNPTLINDWWLSTDTHLGTSDTSGVTDYQKVNATNVYTALSGLGWSLSAIAGIIGNMHHESFLSPAYIQATHRSSLPNSAASLSDVPNSVMLSFYGTSTRGYGVGLVQWDGYTSTEPAGQKLVSFAQRYGLNWYDGDTQTYRLQREYETNIQWQPATLYGTRWTWANYVNNTRTPEESAHIWRICYEVGGDASDATRQANARYWYDYLSGVEPGPGPTPEGWITGEAFSQLALAYDGQYIPYEECDCIHFVNMVWRDIPAAAGHNLTLGTNSIWRSTVTFPTTDPNGQNPTFELWYQDTIENCIATYGFIPAGTLLFHQIGEDGPPAIPDEYRGDGVGNFVHVGIYCGDNQVMQSGGRDGASVPGGGVHSSEYDPEAWNYVAFVVYVDPQAEPGPEPEPEPEIPTWLLYFMSRLKKERVVKYV